MSLPSGTQASSRQPLVVTTSDRVDAPLAQRARSAAEAVGVPYVERHHKLPLKKLLTDTADALIVFESAAVSLVRQTAIVCASCAMSTLSNRSV